MNRDAALQILKSKLPEISQKFGIRNLSLFGSVARDTATETSDIDVLVEFRRPIGLFEFSRLRLYLEETLGCRVDLVTPDALKAQLKERILGEVLHVA